MPELFQKPPPVVQIETALACSAVILNETTLITAGHCTEDLHEVQYEIQIRNPDTKKSYVTKIKKVKRHPQYRIGFKEHPTLPKTFTDIAIVKLARAIPFAFSKANLPQDLGLQNGSLWLVANGSTRSALMSRNQALPTQVQMNQFQCWQVKSVPKNGGPCAGDSGGGYFAIVNNQAYLMAIQSTRTSQYKCDDPRSLSFAVDIQSNLSWIEPLL